MVAAWPEHLSLYKRTGYIKWCLVSVCFSEFIVNRLIIQLSNSADVVFCCVIVINRRVIKIVKVFHKIEAFRVLYFCFFFLPAISELAVHAQSRLFNTDNHAQYLHSF